MITLRPTTMADAELLYEWAMDPETRRQSFHSEAFDFEHHCRWLEQKLKSSASLCLIGIDGWRPVGTIRFETTDEGALVSFTVVPAARGSGYGTALLEAGARHVLENGYAAKVKGCVKCSNAASLRCFEKAGFVRQNDSRVNGILCAVFEWDRQA